MDPADSILFPRDRMYSGTRLETRHLRLRGYHPLRPAFPDCSACVQFGHSMSGPTTPIGYTGRFGLLRFRSPLLTESSFLSPPPGTEMFQFSGFALHTYGFSMQSFRDPGINARLTAPPGFSQFATPFIASWRQDIPHTPLCIWPH